MERVIHLIEEKNNYLEKFCGINAAQLERLKMGNFEELESFREQRENILNIINHIDALLISHSATVQDSSISDHHRRHISKALNHKDDLVQVILAQDLDVMQAIEAAKSEIIVQLKEVVKNRKGVAGYKSGSKTNSVDEEV